MHSMVSVNTLSLPVCMYTNPSTDRHLSANLTSSVKRREPATQQLAAAFNKLCDEMDVEIHHNRAPQGVFSPPRIDRSQLFNLDVDDDLWLDVGLGVDEDEGSSDIPAWLGDDSVRQGIKTRLELDRCLEEEMRVQLERCALQEWFTEEWSCMSEAELREGKSCLIVLSLF